jgi:hypothetical protein
LSFCSFFIAHSFFWLHPVLYIYMLSLACSIRRRALDLLYGMCDVTNAKEIVEELLQVTNPVIVVMRRKDLAAQPLLINLV